VFVWAAITLVFFNLNTFALYSVTDYRMALTLTRIFRGGGVFMPAAILHLTLELLDRRSAGWRGFLLADYVVACCLALLNSFDFFVSELRPTPWGYYSVGTGFYHVFTGLICGNFMLVFGLLLRNIRGSTEPRQRQQLRFWTVGAVIALPLGLTNLLPAYGIMFYPLGNLGSAVWAGIVAYAIIRHRLMDIDVVITKGMAYVGVAVAVIAPAFALALWLQRISFGQIHPDFSFALLVMLLTVGVLFPTLRSRAEERIERSLFGEKHSYRAALSDFTRSIVRILDRTQLLRELTETLTRTLQLDRVAICLAHETDHVYAVSDASGVPAAVAEFDSDHPLVIAVGPRHDGVLRDELEASTKEVDRRAATTCAQNGWEVCVPLSVSGRLIGFIALGRKRNLEAFYAEDLQLLSTLAGEAAIALENARLYDELKKSREIIERAGRLSALGTLAAGIAHEVRNPLVSIQTFFQLAPQRLNDAEFFSSFLKLTAGEVDRISNLITELLSFARTPAHRVHDIELNDLIEHTSLLLEPEARKHRVSLARVLTHETLPVRADGDQIKQVVINLVLNAIQATPAGGTVTLFTRRTTHQKHPFCQIEVRDTGAGIPARLLEDIFNPFFTTKAKGTGLGLSIAHQITVQHGGFITVTSQEDRGSSFCINVPEADGESAAGTTSDDDEPVRFGRLAKM
jgi:signal transduction histidine kinase